MINFIDVTTHNKEVLSSVMKKLPTLVKSGEYVYGKEVQKFEKNFANYCGTKYAIGVNSGTDALILSLLALNKKPGEVLTVSLTFPATIMAILASGHTPRYVDVDETGTMCPIDLKKKINKQTVATIPVHFMGHTCNMSRIVDVLDSNGIPMIEDACQAVGGSHGGFKAGFFGKTGCFSFFPTKTFSCIGDGGMIVTSETETRDKLLKLKDIGRSGREEFNTFGINSRLDEIQALILNEKLPQLNKWVRARRLKARYYDEEIPASARVQPPSKTLSTYHLYVVKVKDNLKAVQYMKRRGVDCRTHYSVPCHRQGVFKTKEKLPVTDFLSQHVLSLPISENISLKDQNIVIDTLKPLLLT